MFSRIRLLCAAIVLAGCATAKRRAADRESTVNLSESAAWSWVEEFQSPATTRLVREALAENRDLKVASARVEQARQRAVVAGADLYPELRAEGGHRIEHRTLANNRTDTQVTRTRGFTLDWEVDLWGRLSDLRGAAKLDWAAEAADYEGSRLSLAGQVVEAVISGYEASYQARLTEESLVSRKNTLAILESRMAAGVADDRVALDVSLARSEIANAEAGLQSDKLAEVRARLILNTLLGRNPQSALAWPEKLPRLMSGIPASATTSLIARRPDILALEMRVAAAQDRESAARKALLPSIRLTADSGTSSTEGYKQLFDPNRLVSSLMASLSAPLFEGGKLRAEVRLSEAEKREFAESYGALALNALREIEDSIQSENYLLQEERARFESAEEASRASELALSQFSRGLDDIITVLEAQRREYQFQSEWIRLRADLLRNRVRMHLALGGDFTHEATW